MPSSVTVNASLGRAPPHPIVETAPTLAGGHPDPGRRQAGGIRGREGAPGGRAGRNAQGERPASEDAAVAIRRAKAARMSWFYSLAYGSDSQAAAHPSVWAFEQFAEVAPDGRGVVVHDRPAPGRSMTNPYNAAVVPFGLILQTAAHEAGDEPFAGRVDGDHRPAARWHWALGHDCGDRLSRARRRGRQPTNAPCPSSRGRWL